MRIGPCYKAAPDNPTLLEVAGIEPEASLPLDGVSLIPLIDGKMTARPKPMGFWNHSINGMRTPSKEWMSDLLKAQNQGREINEKSRLRLDAGVITKQHPEDTFPGHAAWLDWPWKLHRIQGKGKGNGEGEAGAVKVELYNLADDPSETTDLSARQQDRANSMRSDLDRWLGSVVASLNGKDY